MSSELESEEAAHARSRAEADGEGIKLCALMIAAFAGIRLGSRREVVE